MRAVLLGLMMMVACAASAGSYDAGPWTINASLISRGGGARIDGSVSGRLCKVLRVDIFTQGAGGWTGHGVAVVKNVGPSRKLFTTDTNVGGGRGAEIISAYASCIGK